MSKTRIQMQRINQGNPLQVLAQENKALRSELTRITGIAQQQAYLLELTRQSGTIQFDTNVPMDKVELRPIPTKQQIDAMKAEEYERGRQDVINFHDQHIKPIRDTSDFLWSSIIALDAAVTAGHRRDLLEEVIKPGLDEQLSAAFTRLIRLHRSIGSDLGEDTNFIRMITTRIEGVQRFLNREDNGEYLRSHIQESTGDAIRDALQARMSVVKFGGNQEGMKRWRKWLAEEVLRFKEKFPQATASEIKHGILEEKCEFDTNTGGHVPKREIIIEWEIEGLTKFAKVRRKSLSNYIYKLLKDYEDEFSHLTS